MGNDSWWPPYLLQIETSLCATLKKKKEILSSLIENFKRLIDRFRLDVTCERNKGKVSQICVKKCLQKLLCFPAIL